MATDSCLDSTGKALDGNCAGGQVCVTDPEADDFGICLPGGDCANEFRPEPVPPNVMVLLDRSGSMSESIGEEGKKWHIAKDALGKILTAFKGKIRFGLAPFSACNGQQCSPGTIEVPVGDDIAPIEDFLTSADDDYLCESGLYETSIGGSLGGVGHASTWKDAGREHAIVLITDGKGAQCEPVGGPAPDAAADLVGLTPSVRTFVVGFTQDPDNVDAQELAAIASSGGTKQHYLATNTVELEQALDSIGGTAALSCTHTLEDNVPPEGTKIYVYFDASVEAIAEDSADGWTYDPATTTVALHGSSCDKVKAGEVSEVVVSYDCDRGEF